MRICFFILFFASFGAHLSGQTKTKSVGGTSATVTVTAVDGRHVTYSWSKTYGGGQYEAGVKIVSVTDPGGISSNLNTVFANPLNGSGSGSATFNIPVGSRVYLHGWTGEAESNPGSWQYSDDPSGPEVLPSSKKVRVSYFNSQDYPVTVKLVGDPSGTVLASASVPPRSGFIQEVSLPEGDENAVLFVEVAGVEWSDGNNWREAPGAVSSIKAATLPGSTDSPTPTQDVPQPPRMPEALPNNPLNPTPEPPKPRPRPPEPIWKPDAEEAPEVVDTERLDKTTFREGVNKIVKQEALTTDEIRQQNERHEDGKTAADAAATGGLAILQGKQSDAVTAFGLAVANPAALVADEPSSHNMQLNLPGIATVDLDPLKGSMGSILQWIRAIIAVLVAGWMTYWLYHELQQYLFFSSILQPAKGNTVAGSGGQITSAIVAAWSTLVILALPTAMTALWTGAPLLVGAETVNPFVSAPSVAGIGLYLVYGVLPITTILTALTSVLFVKKFGMAVYFGVAAAIRWAIA